MHQVKSQLHDGSLAERGYFSSRYLMFGLNILFWVRKCYGEKYSIANALSLKILGFMIAAIGIYAWIEKDTFENFGRLTMGGTLFFDPALLFVLVGIFMFFIGFAGCVGSLRENTCLLLFVRICSSLTRRILSLIDSAGLLVQFRIGSDLFRSTGIRNTGFHLSRKGRASSWNIFGQWPFGLGEERRWKTIDDHDSKLSRRSRPAKYDRLDSTSLAALLWCE